MSNYHILNGDALAEKIPASLQGSRIIIREAFMEGPVSVSFDAAYWIKRSAYIADTFNTNPGAYEKAFYSQLDLLHKIKSDDTVYLWFEDDVFCQINMWFAVYYITKHSSPNFYRVLPTEDVKHWTGFGDAEEKELLQLFSFAVAIHSNEKEAIRQLWEAYVDEDATRLLVLGDHVFQAIRHLSDVIQAHLDRLNPDITRRQPQAYLREVLQEGNNTFEDIFAAFSRRAGIYGYSDLQIGNELKKMNAYPA